MFFTFVIQMKHQSCNGTSPVNIMANEQHKRQLAQRNESYYFVVVQIWVIARCTVITKKEPWEIGNTEQSALCSALDMQDPVSIRPQDAYFQELYQQNVW